MNHYKEGYQSIYMAQEEDDVAIFWDLENIQVGEAFLVDELLSYAKTHGRVVVARGFADFHKYDPQIATDLVSDFELIHLPHNKFQKNSIDILLAVNATNTLTLYPNIKHYVIISGDYDFRGLVTTLQQHGKLVHIVCEVANTRAELLSQVDSFIDIYDVSDVAIQHHPSLKTEDTLLRDVLTKLSQFLDGTTPVEKPKELSKDEKIKQRAREILKEDKIVQQNLKSKVDVAMGIEVGDATQKIELAIDKLQDAITQTSKENEADRADHNTVLTRLKIIHPDLDGDFRIIANYLGLNPNQKWYISFLRYAEQQGHITINLEGATYYLSIKSAGESSTSKRIKVLFDEMKDAIKSYGKGGKIDMSRLAQLMNDKYSSDYSDLGFKTFKSALLAAQKQNVLELHRSKQNMSSWIVEVK